MKWWRAFWCWLGRHKVVKFVPGNTDDWMDDKFVCIDCGRSISRYQAF